MGHTALEEYLTTVGQYFVPLMTAVPLRSRHLLRFAIVPHAKIPRRRIRLFHLVLFQSTLTPTLTWKCDANLQ